MKAAAGVMRLSRHPFRNLNKFGISSKHKEAHTARDGNDFLTERSFYVTSIFA